MEHSQAFVNKLMACRTIDIRGNFGMLENCKRWGLYYKLRQPLVHHVSANRKTPRPYCTTSSQSYFRGFRFIKLFSLSITFTLSLLQHHLLETLSFRLFIFLRLHHGPKELFHTRIVEQEQGWFLFVQVAAPSRIFVFCFAKQGAIVLGLQEAFR